jgi:hypothetical protein
VLRGGVSAIGYLATRRYSDIAIDLEYAGGKRVLLLRSVGWRANLIGWRASLLEGEPPGELPYAPFPRLRGKERASTVGAVGTKVPPTREWAKGTEGVEGKPPYWRANLPVSQIGYIKFWHCPHTKYPLLGPYRVAQ